MTRAPRDLIILAADSQIQQMLVGLLPRHQSFGIRPLHFSPNDIKVHPEKDGGCRTNGVAFLRNFRKQYVHALLIFDHAGCGSESVAAADLEQQLDEKLQATGWGDCARAVVLDPELETWVWSPSPAVDQVLGWSGRLPSLRYWLVENEWTKSTTEKPSQPKEAMQSALREVGRLPSAALFRKLAEKVSFQQCQDRTFRRFWNALQSWFPPEIEQGTSS